GVLRLGVRLQQGRVQARRGQAHPRADQGQARRHAARDEGRRAELDLVCGRHPARRHPQRQLRDPRRRQCGRASADVGSTPTMNKTFRWLLIAGLAALLAACGGGLLGNQGRIRLVNATTGLGALDLLIDSEAAITGVATASASDYVLRKADTYQLDLRQTGNAATLLTTSTALVADKHQTLVAYNSG